MAMIIIKIIIIWTSETKRRLESWKASWFSYRSWKKVKCGDIGDFDGRGTLESVAMNLEKSQPQRYWRENLCLYETFTLFLWNKFILSNYTPLIMLTMISAAETNIVGV